MSNIVPVKSGNAISNINATLDGFVTPPPPAKTSMQRVGHIAAGLGYAASIPFALTGLSFVPNAVITATGAGLANLSSNEAVQGQGRKLAMCGGAGLAADGAQAALHFIPVVGTIAAVAVGIAAHVPFYANAAWASFKAASSS